MDVISSNTTPARASATRWLVCGVVCLVCWLTACQPSARTETESFESAEVAYREGRYEAALDGYEGFLKRYPRSPLADIAKTRIRTINREVRSMLGRTDTPRPMYRAPSDNATASDIPDATSSRKPRDE